MSFKLYVPVRFDRTMSLSTYYKQVDFPPVRELPPSVIVDWILQGWQDARSAGAASFLHGVLVTLVSWLIAISAYGNWQIAVAAFSAFLLVGPILATGLYALSRRLDEGKAANFADVIAAWCHGGSCLVRLGLLLVGLAIAWVIFSLLMFELFVDIEFVTPLDFLRYVVNQSDLLFLLWTLLGALGASLVFAGAVIAVPLLVDRDIPLQNALLISIHTVDRNPITLACWAFTLMLLTGLSLVSAMLGFILLYPVMGHASWRLYRDLVNADSLPVRTSISP